MLRVLADARVPAGGPARYAAALLRGLGRFEELTLGMLGSGSGWLGRFTPWGRRAVATVARRWRADLIHGLHLELPAGGPPGVVTIQDLIPLDFPASMPSPLRRAVFAAILAGSCARAARIIVPSPLVASRLERRGVPTRRIAVVPHGVGPEFRPLDAAAQAAARHRFAGGRPYVASAATAKPHKNLRGLVASAGLLGGHAAVRCTGMTVPWATPAVGFVGSLADEDLPGFYGGAEAVVVPSHVEGFGLPALEALACGVPVVAGAGLGALPYLRPGIVEVDVSSPAAIAQAVRRVLDDDEHRATLAAAGRAAAAALSEDAMARATLALYRAVAGA